MTNRRSPSLWCAALLPVSLVGCAAPGEVGLNRAMPGHGGGPSAGSVQTIRASDQPGSGAVLDSSRTVGTIAARALDCLKAGVAYEHNPAVRVEAIEAMDHARRSRFKPGDARRRNLTYESDTADRDPSLPWIRSALLDDHPAVRFAACLAIGNAGDRVSESAIERSLSDPDPNVRISALYARHRFGRTEHTGKIATYLLHRGDDSRVGSASPAGTARSSPAIPGDPTVRRNAALVLGMLGEPGAIPVLARAVRDDPDPGVRFHALEAMARLGNAEARQELTFMTNAGVGSDETMALLALGATEDRQFVETYRYKLATAAHVETRLAAAKALGMIGLDEGFDVAIRGLIENVAPTGKAGSDRAAPGVAGSKRLAPAAQNTRQGPGSTGDAQNDTPADQILRARLLAAAALGAIGRIEALGDLEKRMNDNADPRIQIAAARAILEIADTARRSRDIPGDARR